MYPLQKETRIINVSSLITDGCISISISSELKMVASASAASLVSRARGSIAMGGHTNTRIQMTNTVLTQKIHIQIQNNNTNGNTRIQMTNAVLTDIVKTRIQIQSSNTNANARIHTANIVLTQIENEDNKCEQMQFFHKYTYHMLITRAEFFNLLLYFCF